MISLRFKKPLGLSRFVPSIPAGRKRSILDRLLSSEIGEYVMPEMHMWDMGDDGVYRKMSFCGPFTKIHKRLDIRNGRVHAIRTQPINDLDRACMLHDLSYEFNDEPSKWIDADLALYREAIRIRDSTSGVQRQTAKFVAEMMKKKGRLHITRNVL